MEVHYANIVAYRVTNLELVLEFGNFFSGQDNDRKQADHTDFKTRIVMPADMLDVMIQALNQAKDARDQARQAAAAEPTLTLASEKKHA